MSACKYKLINKTQTIFQQFEKKRKQNLKFKEKNIKNTYLCDTVNIQYTLGNSFLPYNMFLLVQLELLFLVALYGTHSVVHMPRNYRKRNKQNTQFQN